MSFTSNTCSKVVDINLGLQMGSLSYSKARQWPKSFQPGEIELG